MFTETSTISEVTILPLEGNVQVKTRTVVEKAGDVVSTKDHYQLYASDNAEGAAILTAFNSKVTADALAEKTAALAAKATAEAALTAEQTAHAATKAELGALKAVPAADPTDPMVDDLQIRLALNQAGLREAVESAVLAGDQDLKDWWARARRFFRSNERVVAMGETLGVSPQALDDLWALAATL
jgi:hypothetical protein